MSIQLPKSLTFRDDPKPFACSRRSVLKFYLVSVDVNKNNTGHHFTFAPVNLAGSAINLATVIGSTVINTGTRRDSLTQYGVDIPRALETH